MNSIIGFKRVAPTLSGVFYGQFTLYPGSDEVNINYQASFLRFFNDGTVLVQSVAFKNIDIVSVWTNDVSKWLNRESYHDFGTYTLTNKVVEFWSGSNSGWETFYCGSYDKDELILCVSEHPGQWKNNCIYKRLTIH